MENFKKGSLVPRRLGILLAEKKKAQHWLTFGTDVIWDGKTLTSLQPLKWGEALIKVRSGMSAPRKNGTRQPSGFSIGDNWVGRGSQDSQTGVTNARFEKKTNQEAAK